MIGLHVPSSSRPAASLMGCGHLVWRISCVWYIVTTLWYLTILVVRCRPLQLCRIVGCSWQVDGGLWTEGGCSRYVSDPVKVRPVPSETSPPSPIWSTTLIAATFEPLRPPPPRRPPPFYHRGMLFKSIFNWHQLKIRGIRGGTLIGPLFLTWFEIRLV